MKTFNLLSSIQIRELLNYSPWQQLILHSDSFFPRYKIQAFHPAYVLPFCSAFLRFRQCGFVTLYVAVLVTDIVSCVLIRKKKMKLAKNDPSFIWDQCCHLTLCLRLMEPNLILCLACSATPRSPRCSPPS